MYTEVKPNHLSKLIRTIWHSDSDVDPNEGHIVPPSLSPQLVIKIYDSDAETVFSGPVTQQKQYPFIARANYFGIEFTQYVGAVFDNVLLKDLKDGSANIEQILGIDLVTLTYQLQESNNWTAQKQLIETAMRQKFPDMNSFLNHNVLVAMDEANKVHGNISIKKLAICTGVSQRQLERLFLKHTGLSPKTFCTTLRMRRVLDLLRNSQRTSLARLALACGYADQAHLANEFRRVMGTSISAYMNLAR